jgi:hypothetical protein
MDLQLGHNTCTRCDKPTALLQRARIFDKANFDLELASKRRFCVKLVFALEVGMSKPKLLRYTLTTKSVIGRSDEDTPTPPHIDFTPYEGWQKGVSRCHAMFFWYENTLLLTDLGSTNGTFLNKARLRPHYPYMVGYGDEVTFGTLRLRVFFRQEDDVKQPMDRVPTSRIGG